jgi:hypothetical protein
MPRRLLPWADVGVRGLYREAFAPARPPTPATGPAGGGSGLFKESERVSVISPLGKLPPSASHDRERSTQADLSARRHHSTLGSRTGRYGVPVAAPESKPDFGVVTPDCGHWEGRYFIWDLPRNAMRESGREETMFLHVRRRPE